MFAFHHKAKDDTMSPVSLTSSPALSVANLATHEPLSHETQPQSSHIAPRRKMIVAMTGATGAILGIKILLALRKLNVETHLMISKWAEATIKYETDYNGSNVRALADHTYTHSDQAAPISSRSFRADGMKTLASVAIAYCDDLISRAADVMLKERRKLVMAVRETPLSEIHLRNMLTVTSAGAIVFPPVPAFYTRPSSVEDLVDQSVGRMLDIFNLDTANFERWTGMHKA